ncbi:Notchless protein [Nosema bombycis CQ1]|uniref:Notchless protein n=1 Tax=Nosema bombycis (strain CQ1 / CVCC 102059) TaxID=578461 RepID=R0MET9_NOSB1|nr:Notchless protein [Nosema bombycis CQ1]|eukprot:EOB12650.1 Notchless protein [Nosema bombycis CQ1]
MSRLFLVEFENQDGKVVSDRMQVPGSITSEQLKSLVDTTLSLYVEGSPILDTLEKTVEGLSINTDEEVIKIRMNKEEPATQAATFCSSAYSGHEGPVLCIRYQGNTLVTGGSDCTVRFWDIRTKTQKMIQKKHSHWVQCVEISPCGEFVVSGSVDGSVKMFDSNGEFIRSFIGHKDAVVSIKIIRNIVITGSRDKSVKICDLEGNCIFAYTHSKAVTCLTTGEDFIASGSRDGKIKVYIESKKTLLELNGHSEGINCLSSSGVYLASGSDDGSIVIWKDFQVHKRLKHEREVLSLSFAPNLVYLASGSFDKSVRIWSVETGKLITKYFHVDFVYKVLFLNDLVISCSRDKTVKLFKVTKKKIVSDLVCDDEVYCFDYANNQLVCGSKSNKVYFFK